MRQYIVYMANVIHQDDSKNKNNDGVGLAQARYPHANHRSALEELNAILIKNKDIKKNVDASIAWLQSQPDFFINCTLYTSSFFGTR
jgi:hypothetical protein